MINGSDYAPVECVNIPKILFQEKQYEKLSVDAKLLYSLLLDRKMMAIMNGWVDQCGTAYVIYPKSEMKKHLNASRYRVDMALDELEKCGQMVVVTQLNPGRPCQIYVKDITGNMMRDMEEKSMCTMMKDANDKNGIPSLQGKDLLIGIGVAVVAKILIWQKQQDSKKFRKGVEYGSAKWGDREDIKPYMADNPWMNIPLTATESITMESRPKNPKYARNKNILVIGGSGSGKTRFFVKPSVMQMNCSLVLTDPKGLICKVQRNKRFFITKKRLFACIFKGFGERR